MVDCANNKLVDTTTNRQVNAQHSPLHMNIGFINNSADITAQTIVEKYPNLISPHRNPDASKPKVYHRIETGSNPSVYTKTRQLSTAKYDVAKEEFRKLQKAGIISPSKSEWSSALHMVTKSDGTFRPVGDYRQLMPSQKWIDIKSRISIP